MKKTLIALTLALAASLSFAQGKEEVCYDLTNAHVSLRNLFNRDSDSFELYLEKINASSFPTKMKNKLRENAYWVKNNQDVSEDIFRKMAYLRCTMQSN